MKRIIQIAILIVFLPSIAQAQDLSDSLKAERIDSIIQSRWGGYSTENEFTQKEVQDTVNQVRVVGQYLNGALISIYCQHLFFLSTSFKLYNNELICVIKNWSSPDIYGGPPPRTTYTFYFENNQVFYSLVSGYLGGANTFKNFKSIDNEYVKEFNYYRSLLSNQ